MRTCVLYDNLLLHYSTQQDKECSGSSDRKRMRRTQSEGIEEFKSRAVLT